MKKNRFLRLTATVLSVSVLASGFAITPIQAKVNLPDLKDINLSKKEKIGIGVGVPSGTAVILGVGFLFKVAYEHNKRKNVGKPASSSGNEMKKWEDNFWNIFVSTCNDKEYTDLAGWTKLNYPELEKQLSKVRPEGDSAVVIKGDMLLEHVPDMRGLANTGDSIDHTTAWLLSAKEKSEKSSEFSLPKLEVKTDKRKNVYK